MTTDFKKAELIELHDQNVKIHPQSYSDALAGWKEYSDKEIFVINGEAISDLAKYFGIEPRPIMKKSWDSNKQHQHKIESDEIEILRKRVEDIGSGYIRFNEGSHTIGELWAKIIGERLLEIKFTSLNEDEYGQEEQDMVFVTYSGSYTVWWHNS